MAILDHHRAILTALHRRPADSPTRGLLREFFAFGYKEAISCVFPVFIFGMLAVTKIISIPFIPRYDLLLFACLSMQYFMYRLGLESKKEVGVICFFHLLGVSMEIFKVSQGAWAYPEEAYTKVMGVPLYSGFMYASVASYICQAWKNFDLRLHGWPSLPNSGCFAVAIYGNFYTNAYVTDVRLIIIPLLIIGFWKTWVSFETNGIVRRMPMVLSFLLIAFFIWIAENVGTFLGAWRYPYQDEEWSMVRLQLMSSWFLLVIVSIIIVAALKQIEEK
jgi:uncharacterized membrane protein YoaT (DUF817 family)